MAGDRTIDTDTTNGSNNHRVTLDAAVRMSHVAAFYLRSGSGPVRHTVQPARFPEHEAAALAPLNTIDELMRSPLWLSMERWRGCTIVP